MSKIFVKDKKELFETKAKVLAEKYSVDVSSVYHARKNYNKKKYENSDFFTKYLENIDTSDKAYILGLLVADGTTTKYQIVLSLNSKDREILEKIHTILKVNNPIKDYKYKNNSKIGYSESSILSLYSVTLSESIKKWGLVPNKTDHTYFPNISEDLKKDFIRGVFDGDGCVHKDKMGNYHFKIVGNVELLNEIQNILIKNCNLSKTTLSVCNKGKNNIVALQYGGNKTCLKIYNYLYNNSSLFMERKYKKFKQIENGSEYEVV